MNNTDFTYLLQHPQQITSQQTDELKSIIDEFPYFQSARAIYLKGLKNKESFKYNQELKTTAAFTTDRSILFDFITSQEFIEDTAPIPTKQSNEHLKNIDVEAEDISVNRKVTIDDDLNQHIQDTTGVLDPELFQPKIELSKIANFERDDTQIIEDSKEEIVEEPKEVTIQESASPSEILNLGKPLNFTDNETHSFNEWLLLTSTHKPIQRTETEEKTSTTDKKEAVEAPSSAELEQSKKDKKFDLIDQFITNNPKLKPTKSSAKNVNIADKQMIQPEALMTETLARIYVEQKNYKKAIQSYKILSLKYPEKSALFAIQIKAVKQLQEHNKKE